MSQFNAYAAQRRRRQMEEAEKELQIKQQYADRDWGEAKWAPDTWQTKLGQGVDAVLGPSYDALSKSAEKPWYNPVSGFGQLGKWMLEPFVEPAREAMEGKPAYADLSSENPLNWKAEPAIADLVLGGGDVLATGPGKRAVKAVIDLPGELSKNFGEATVKGLPKAAPMTEGKRRGAKLGALKSEGERSPQKVRADAKKIGVSPTVVNPTNVAYPGVYRNPKELVGKAEVAPEDPAMKRLFGVTRDDLFEMSEQGKRKGNITDRPYKTAPKPKGSKHTKQVMTPQNAGRILDIVAEAEKRPELYKGMVPWYVMDPAFQRLEQLVGKDEAIKLYNSLNTYTGMASPQSEVLTELNRGTAANWLANEGRFEDFIRYGGKPNQPGSPADMAAIEGHIGHKTSHGKPMQKYEQTGEVDMGTVKVPTYIPASGVPETGFQTKFAVPDAHWSRLVGLPDVRPMKNTGEEMLPNTAAAKTAEMVDLHPWWEEKVAKEVDIEPVPAQAVVWGSGANATGVSSPVGAPKLELLAKQIMKAADRMGVTPEEARDLILMGKAHAGEVDPELLKWLAGASASGALVFPFLAGEGEE